MLATIPPTLIVPLKMDEHGSIRVSGTRVTLDTLIACYQQGYTPEDIHRAFSTVPLNDIYAVISYYLSHQLEVDEYLRERDEAADKVRDEIEANYSPEKKERIKYLLSLMEQRKNRS